MNYAAGRKGGKRVSASPTHSNHQSPTSASSPLPRIKLNVRPTHSRPDSASSSRSRTTAAIQRRNIFDDDSSSDLTPPEDDDDDNDDALQDDDETEDEFPHIKSAPRKGKQRESLSHTSPTSLKSKGKATASSNYTPPSQRPAEPSRPTITGPNGRARKRVIKLGDLARKRARDDKFGFGGDRFGGATPTQSAIVPSSSYMESDSTSSYGDDESERETVMSGVDDETDDEFMGTLPEALAGQEIEDLAYGGGQVDFGMEGDGEQEWWQEEEDDEDFIANLTGSDIDALQSQSSVAASDSDDPMTSSTEETTSDDAMDEFGYPKSFRADDGNVEPSSDAPLILMENWDGQFVLVQPRSERSRSRRGNRDSQTNGSVGDSTSISAGEQQLMIDADANDETESESDWSGLEGEDDGGDTTDSMAEEDMPVLDSPALDEIIGQQLNTDYSNPLLAGNLIDSSILDNLDLFTNPSIVVTDTTAETPALSTTTSASAVGSPVASTSTSTSTPPVSTALPSAPSTPIAALAPPAPVMGTFIVPNEPCAHAVIDGSHATTKSPFTRRRRNKPLETSSVTSKRRSHLASASPLSPMGTKARFSSIPGHPRFIAARRAAQTLVDPLDRENTPSEEDDNAFSLEDMLDASVLHMNESSSSSAPAVQPELRHLFRFDKVPVSMYMRRNFNSNSTKMRTVAAASPSNNVWQSYSTTPPRTAGLTTSHSSLTDTLADTLAGPANRMLISPLLAPMPSSEADDATPMSRKERRKARRRGGYEMTPLQI